MIKYFCPWCRQQLTGNQKGAIHKRIDTTKPDCSYRVGLKSRFPGDRNEPYTERDLLEVRLEALCQQEVLLQRSISDLKEQISKLHN